MDAMEKNTFLQTFKNGKYAIGAELVHTSETGMTRVYRTWVQYADTHKLLGNFSLWVAAVTGLPYSKKHDGVVVKGTGFSGYQHIEEYLSDAAGRHINVEKIYGD